MEWIGPDGQLAVVGIAYLSIFLGACGACISFYVLIREVTDNSFKKQAHEEHYIESLHVFF